MNQKFEGILRHVLSLVGGLLIAIGVNEGLVMDLSETVMVAAGAIFAVIAFVRSWISKKPDEEIIAEAVKIALAEFQPQVKQK